jgi:hypothetical protein
LDPPDFPAEVIILGIHLVMLVAHGAEHASELELSFCRLPGPSSIALGTIKVTEQPGISEFAQKEATVPSAHPFKKFGGSLKAGAKRHARSKKRPEQPTPEAAAKEEQLRKVKEISERLGKALEDSKAAMKAPGWKSLKQGLQMGFAPPVVMGDEYIMASKGHGTYSQPVQRSLRWGCDHKLADRICNFNRHAAEDDKYFMSTSFLDQEPEDGPEKEVTFYDSNTGKPLFFAPRGRNFAEFVEESRRHGWPSFRDDEVNWTLVRVLHDGETVSVHGTHLGHNLPDGKGNRYCINLVSIAGRPKRD